MEKENIKREQKERARDRDRKRCIRVYTADFLPHRENSINHPPG